MSSPPQQARRQNPIVNGNIPSMSSAQKAPLNLFNGESFQEVVAIACEFRLLISDTTKFQQCTSSKTLSTSTAPLLSMQSTLMQSSGSAFQPTQDPTSQIQNAVSMTNAQSLLAIIKCGESQGK